jgi:hypothetical protein
MFQEAEASLLLERWNRSPGNTPESIAAMKNSNAQIDHFVAKTVTRPVQNLALRFPPSPYQVGKQQSRFALTTGRFEWSPLH